MERRNISEHPYKDAAAEEFPDDFEVYETDEGWWWSFSPVWRDPGPFKTKEEAIAAGEKCLSEDGTDYFKNF